jgi:hypothetical protein
VGCEDDRRPVPGAHVQDQFSQRLPTDGIQGRKWLIENNQLRAKTLTVAQHKGTGKRKPSSLPNR